MNVCPSCEGTGRYMRPWDSHLEGDHSPCSPCRGAGFLTDAQWEEYWALHAALPPTTHQAVTGNTERVRPQFVLTESEVHGATHGRLTDDQRPEEVTHA
jgi:hypothetical protein